MKKQIALSLTIITIVIIFVSCQSSKEKNLEIELAKKDSIIELQKKIIDEKENNYDLDQIKPIVVPKNSDIRLGDNYTAEIYLAAQNSKDPFEVYLCEKLDTINNEMTGKIDTIKFINGIAKINFKPNRKGNFILQGGIKLNHHKTNSFYPFSKEYSVN